ncbi:MAG: hypothetical protein LBT46_15365 [Planctomycetaceae bacterium]|jgi:hypothetical protein|nr:hypothetical protein [Planctomycetaceae bacterium]
MEPFKNSFYNIAVQAADLNKASTVNQRMLIDNVTAESPILAAIPFEKASHDYHNLFERVTAAQGVDVVDLDGPLPIIDSETQLDQSNLTPLGGKILMPEDKVIKYGGVEKYLAKRLPPAMRQSGMKIEKSLFLNNFLGKAVEFSNAVSASETPADMPNYAAMAAITWSPGEVTGLFSPLPYADPRLGQVFETSALNGGNRYDYRHPVDKVDIVVYGATVKTLIGMQLENKLKIAALVNIGATAVPTATQLVELVKRASFGTTTRIYCNPSLALRIAAYYSTQNHGNGLITVQPGGQVSIVGVPVITSFNIPEAIGRISNASYVA